MKQNQYLVPAAILALAVVILIVAFKPSKDSVSDGMSKETTTLATPSARGGVTAPEMLPLLAKVTELTEKTVQSQNEAQLAKNQAEQLASRLGAANQALEMSQQEVARLAKIIQDANDRSIKIGMHIDEAVRRLGSPSEIVQCPFERHIYNCRLKSTPGTSSRLNQTTYDKDGVKFSNDVLEADVKSAQRQDRQLNKNDDQAWLIGYQWIFIDQYKIITHIGPSQYRAE